jgi:hypothetical protein
VRRATGLDARAVGRSLQQRLIDAGLVLRADDGTILLLGEAFAQSAQGGRARPAPTEHDDEPAEVARVLRAFARDGRLMSIPAVHSKRLVILDWLVQRFEPGRRYSEQMVNLVIAGAPRYRRAAPLPRRRRFPVTRVGRILALGRPLRACADS